YDANADEFTAFRKDLPAQSGPYAASSSNLYLVGRTILNPSLVPLGTLETASGTQSGFAFIDQSALRTTTASPASAGVIQHVDLLGGIPPQQTSTVEAPLLAIATLTTSTGVNPFTRTLAPLYSRNAIISLTQS